MQKKCEAIFSRQTELWETPQALFDELNEEFHFGIDVAALPENAKCATFFTPEDNGLKKSWSGYGSVWCNPPYGRGIKNWVRKAAEEARRGNTIVMLIPVRTDTIWFHDYIYQKPNVEIRFIRGRLRFSGASVNAPFPNMIVIFKGR